MRSPDSDPVICEVKKNLDRSSIQDHFAYMRTIALIGILISAAVLIIHIIRLNNGQEN